MSSEPVGRTKLTRIEAQAIVTVANFGWADIEALTDHEVKFYGFNKRWFGAAKRAMRKLRVIARGRPAKNCIEVKP